jgi:hypothetical protein
MLDKLHDFNAFFRIYNKDLINSIKFDFSSGSIIQNFIKNNTLTLDPGFIDKYKMGSFDGYRITEGVEGCGRYLYYFPISSNQTLMINRNFYAETFQGDKSELSKIPGFITFEQEELIFKDILLSVKRFEKENDIKNIEKKNSWLLDSKTGLFYDPSWEITPETYRTPVQEVNGESPQIVGYRFTLPSGNSINWGGNQSSCSNNEFPKFQYGVSTVVCLKGVRSNVGLSDVRLIIPKEDLNAFGDFVLKNGLSSTIQNSSTYIIEVYSNNSSSGADRNYKGELTFLNSKLISGFQNYNVLQGGGCTTNCERKTECIIKNQQWIGKNGDECTIEKYISLTKEGIEQQIKAKEIIPSEDFKNCHSVVCYRIKK